MGLSRKDFEQRAKRYERQWQDAMDERDFAKAYKAEMDYRQNYEQQAEELKNMDPNSRDYEKAELEIDKQKSKAWDMYHQQRLACTNDELQESMESLEKENNEIYGKMEKAAKSRNVGEYNYQRKQFERNIEVQETMKSQLKYDGVQCEDTINQQRNNELNSDINMRNNMQDWVAKREATGKSVPQDMKNSTEEYVRNVKKDEIEVVKKQNEQIIEAMRERGASEQEIANTRDQQLHGQFGEEWVEKINR